METTKLNSSATIKDVAREAEVSIGTVSRVFNNHINVKEEIRQRVLKAARQVGYARTVGHDQLYLASQMVKEIGFLFCLNMDTQAIKANPFWSLILNGVESETQKYGIKLTYRSLDTVIHNPALLLATLQSMQLHGFLLVGPFEKETIAICQSLHLPFVLIDNAPSGLFVDSILSNNFDGALMVVNYLIEQGHRQIACISAPQRQDREAGKSISTIEQRFSAYQYALFRANLPLSHDLIEYSNLCIDGGYAACRRLLERNIAFTALFCVNDELAVGAMKALRDAGRHIPEDISITGFDDISLAEHVTPPLTTVRVDKMALGMLAVRALLARAADPAMPAVSNILHVELIKRASVSRRL